jgi:hypothetical protein
MVYTGSPNKFVPDSKGGIVRIQCHYMRDVMLRSVKKLIFVLFNTN